MWRRGDLALAVYSGEWITPSGDRCVGIAPGRVLTVRNVANIKGQLGLHFGAANHWFAALAFRRIPPLGEITGFEEPRRNTVRTPG